MALLLIIQDRNAVLQKSKMLRGTNILISEDFPKAVLEKREQLVKFAKEVREVVLFGVEWSVVWTSLLWSTCTIFLSGTEEKTRLPAEPAV